MEIKHHWWAEHGGPAFPTAIPAGNGHEEIQFKGISVRDYYAAAALQGLCVNERFFGAMDQPSQKTQIVQKAFAYADAMLKEREKT